MQNALNHPATEEHQDEPNRKLLADLFTPSAPIFWSDLLATTAIGWGAFVLACLATPLSPAMFALGLVSVVALYRALIFVHELSHLRTGTLPGFATAWNLLVGLPLLFPSFVYVGVHADHHRPSTYGTAQDPEYLPFAGKRGAIVGFLAQSLILPGVVFVRFVVLAPVALVFPPLHRFLERHASSLSMNIQYVRRLNEAERERIVRSELAILALWSGALALLALGLVPWRVLALWYAVLAGVSFINALRTLGAHRYEGDGTSFSRNGQLLDSVDIPGDWFTELWAPVGLRYHALHHFFPSLPYHNLAKARTRLLAHLGSEAPYRRAESPNLRSALRTLWK